MIAAVLFFTDDSHRDPRIMANPPSKFSAADLDPALQAEIDAALGDVSVADLMAAGGPADAGGPQRGHGGATGPASTDESRFEPGARLSGAILRVGTDDAFVELGPKVQGVVSLTQFDAPPREGQRAEFTVIRFDREEGLVHLGRVGAVQKGDWDVLQKGQVVEARVTGVNKGGLEMEVGQNIRAFMPAGQVDLRHIPDLGVFVGHALACEVIEINRDKKRLVLSRRAVLAREAEEKRAQTLETLAVGQDVEGVVRKIMPFGAFVDIGGVDGLIHIGDLSYDRVHKVEDVLQEGQIVKAKVLKIDAENHRIGLGLKQCQADPFAATAAMLVAGAEATGRVTRLTDFGAFVQLAPGVEGLIHISELSHDRVSRPSQIVKVDEIVRVKVLNVDPSTRRIGLSLKALQAQREEEAPNRPDDAALARLRAKFGAGRTLKGGLG